MKDNSKETVVFRYNSTYELTESVATHTNELVPFFVLLCFVLQIWGGEGKGGRERESKRERT